ncbi:hypothetical protein D9619_000809 [Psilocybe cf. subviscida]|uniref:Importin N-terminal domain-containing protein n=1 Tax=Psilocybe cf. subviscida TaxID=2480587 RepID=A0A8H5BEY8_9AGAR|nr:hypothetical protein D9619_000809 [Psilocybe cf. subviscida]
MDTGRNRGPPAMGVQVESVSPAELYEVVVGACSQDISRIQASSTRLKDMLDMFGTYDALQEIASRRNFPLSVRQQAIIQFKNAVVSHWRSRKLLSDEHRARIRQRCLMFVDEEDDTIAECNEVVVAKLARSDYPSQWPGLISDLVTLIDGLLQQRYISMIQDPHDTLRLRRSLRLLKCIVKELSSIKLLNGIRAMAQTVEQLRTPLKNYYATMSNTFSAGNINIDSLASQSTYDNILLSHLVYKCLTRMDVWVWNKMGRSSQPLSPEERARNLASVEELFQNCAAQIKQLMSMRKDIMLSVKQQNLLTNPQVQRTVSILTRHLRTYGKYFRRLQQLSQERFVALPGSGELIMLYWSQIIESTNHDQSDIADSDEALYPVRFLVQGMVLFKDSLSQFTPVKRNGTPNANTLSEEFVQNAIRVLISRFMCLNTGDLENWMADPEEWVNVEEKENDQWEYEIRACSERVLVQLCNQFSDIVVPLLAATFQQIGRKSFSMILNVYRSSLKMIAQPPADLNAVVQKEALYCAIGRCALRLKNVIQLDTWLNGPFNNEAHDSNPTYPIIKRRIAWLIGKWVSDDCLHPSNTKIWDILVHLLQDRGAGSDAVVRLTAATALRECVDSTGFDANVLAPYLMTTVTNLIGLIGEADTLESKRKVDQTLNTVIEQSGMLSPFLNFAVKENSTPLGPLVVPLVRDSLSPQLDVDALKLWESALRNTASVASINGNACLRDLFPTALELVATNLDLLGTVTSIIESYFILDAEYILRTSAKDVFLAFRSAFSNKLVDINAKDLIQALNLLIQVSTSDMWGEAMHTSGLFAQLLKVLITGEADTLLLTEHIYLFSRMTMSDKNMFLQLMSASAPLLNQQETKLYDLLLDQWWGKFDNMSEPRHRKITAMGIAALVSSGRPEVLQRLPGEIFNLWMDVFGELKEAQEQASLHNEQAGSEPPSPGGLVRFWELDAVPSSYWADTEGTPEYERRQALYNKDPIRVIPLVGYVGAQLREAEQIIGGAEMQRCLSTTDPTVLKQVQDTLARG